MLDLTDTRWAPWHVIDANDKKSARMAALTTVAEAMKAAVPSDPPPVRPEMEQLSKQLLQKRD